MGGCCHSRGGGGPLQRHRSPIMEPVSSQQPADGGTRDAGLADPRGAALCAPRYVAFHSINPAADTASVAAHNTVHRHRGRKMTGAALVNERTLGMGLNTAYWLRLGRICFMRCWCVWVSVQGRCPQDEWWWWCQLPPALQTPVISDNRQHSRVWSKQQPAVLLFILVTGGW